MKSRTLLNLGLAGIAILLSLLVFYEPGLDQAPVKKLTNFNKTQFSHIKIDQRDGNTIELAKEGAHWQITAPINVQANEQRIDSLLNIATTTSYAQFSTSGRDLSAYKLDAPRVQLHLDDITIAFGNTDPVNHRRYVRIADTVHLITDIFYYHLITDMSGYISPLLLPTADPITSIKLPGISLARSESGQWHSHTRNPEASVGKLENFISRWQHAQALNVKRHVAASTNAKTRGKIRIKLASGKVIDLAIMEKEATLYLVRKDISMAYQMPPNSKQTLLTISDDQQKDTSGNIQSGTGENPGQK